MVNKQDRITMKKLYIQPATTTYQVCLEGAINIGTTEREGRGNDKPAQGSDNEEPAKWYGVDSSSIWED
jgi:hypothetical protein